MHFIRVTPLDGVVTWLNAELIASMKYERLFGSAEMYTEIRTVHPSVSMNVRETPEEIIAIIKGPTAIR